MALNFTFNWGGLISPSRNLFKEGVDIVSIWNELKSELCDLNKWTESKLYLLVFYGDNLILIRTTQYTVRLLINMN